MENDLEEKIKNIAKLIVDSNYAIILSGAGVSTESGIPDFRGRSGIWKEFNPLIYGNIAIMKKDPSVFWKLGRKIAPTLLKAKPNPGHIAIAELEKMKKIKCVITQNIDGLHQAAGSERVYEVHGSLNKFICMQCSSNYSLEYVIPKILRGTPKCDSCGSYLKPNVVLFGESLPEDQVEKAQEEAEKADLIIVTGSALEVAPVNLIPKIVTSHGGKFIIINDESTWLDEVADIVIHNKTGIILPKLVQDVKKLL